MGGHLASCQVFLCQRDLATIEDLGFATNQESCPSTIGDLRNANRWLSTSRNHFVPTILRIAASTILGCQLGSWGSIRRAWVWQLEQGRQEHYQGSLGDHGGQVVPIPSEGDLCGHQTNRRIQSPTRALVPGDQHWTKIHASSAGCACLSWSRTVQQSRVWLEEVSGSCTMSMTPGGYSLSLSSSTQRFSTHSVTEVMKTSELQMHSVETALQPVATIASVKQTA